MDGSGVVLGAEVQRCVGEAYAELSDRSREVAVMDIGLTWEKT